MTRLIDADALFEKAYSRMQEGEVFYGFEGWEIDNAPTVEERKKSRWIALNQHGFFAKEYKCESCESVVDMNCYTRECDYDYCPYCGAEITVEE